jgi:hypothetical protein
MFIKKGAMFGLDARIALAIFGALSVISGAALYSAIQDSRVTAILTEMDNVGKATTAFYLDTGIYPPAESATNTLDAIRLTTDTTPTGMSGWQGPYLSFEDGATARMLDHSIYGEVALMAAIDGNWSDAEGAGSKCLTGSTSCSVFVCYSGLSDDIQAALEAKADGATGAANTGTFRYTSSSFACLKSLTFPKTSAVN